MASSRRNEVMCSLVLYNPASPPPKIQESRYLYFSHLAPMMLKLGLFSAYSVPLAQVHMPFSLCAGEQQLIQGHDDSKVWSIRLCTELYLRRVQLGVFCLSLLSLFIHIPHLQTNGLL